MPTCQPLPQLITDLIQGVLDLLLVLLVFQELVDLPNGQLTQRAIRPVIGDFHFR